MKDTTTHASEETIENGGTDKQFFVTDENYQLLRSTQQRIFKETEISPSIRKLVNTLITEENLNKLAAQFIQKLS